MSFSTSNYHSENASGEVNLGQKRARNVCNRCRVRKIRCDAAFLGAPCVNCRHDGLPCELITVKKARGINSSKPSRGRPLDTSLPGYLKPLPFDLPKSDEKYLRSKGVLSSPSPYRRKELWETYFRVIHPVVPILDRDETLHLINSDEGGRQISLLLFHCINLIARLFLDLHESYYRKEESLRYMFEKARVLYDFNLETDQIAILQSALLLTYYPQPLNSTKGPAHWLAQAVSIAYTIGLHRDPIGENLTARQISVRKQLWWSLYVRERTLVLDMGLPWMIDEGDYDISMLSNKDLHLAPLVSTAEWPKQDLNLEKRPPRTCLGLLFLQKVKLAMVLGQLSPLSPTCYDWSDRSIKTQLPRLLRRRTNLEDLDSIGRKLDRWRAEMEVETFNNDRSISETERAEDPDFDLLQVHYDSLLFTCHVAAHHIACLRWLQTTDSAMTDAETVMKPLRAATWTIIHWAENLLCHKVKNHLEVIGPSAVRPLLLYVMLSQKSPSPFLTAMEASRIHSFLLHVGEGDPFFSQAFSCLGYGTDTMVGLVSSTVTEGSVSQTEPQPHQGASIFDGILSDLNMDFDGFVSELSYLKNILHPCDPTLAEYFQDFASLGS